MYSCIQAAGGRSLQAAVPLFRGTAVNRATGVRLLAAQLLHAGMLQAPQDKKRHRKRHAPRLRMLQAPQVLCAVMCKAGMYKAGVCRYVQGRSFVLAAQVCTAVYRRPAAIQRTARVSSSLSGKGGGCLMATGSTAVSWPLVVLTNLLTTNSEPGGYLFLSFHAMYGCIICHPAAQVPVFTSDTVQLVVQLRHDVANQRHIFGSVVLLVGTKVSSQCACIHCAVDLEYGPFRPPPSPRHRSRIHTHTYTAVHVSVCPQP